MSVMSRRQEGLRWGELGEGDRELLACCAVAQPWFTMELLEVMSGGEDEALLKRCDGLRERGALELVEDEHDLWLCVKESLRCEAREALATHVLRERWELSHALWHTARVRQALAQSRGGFQALEWRVLGRARGDLERALCVVMELGREARVLEAGIVALALRRGEWSRAYEVSEGWLGEGGMSGDEGWELLLWLDVMALSDEPWRAVGQIEELTRGVVRGGALDELVLFALLRGAELAAQLEDESQREALITRCEEWMQGQRGRSRERVRLALARALGAIYGRDWVTSLALCEESLQRVERDEELASLRGKIHYYLGHIYKNQGRYSESVQAYEEARRWSEAHEDFAALTELSREVVWQALDSGDEALACEELERFEALVTRHELSWQRGVLHMLRGQLAMQRWSWEEAMGELEEARAALASSQQRYMLAASLYFEFLCCWAIGDRDRARGYVEQGQEVIPQISTLMGVVCYRCGQALCAIWDGKLEEARAVLEATRVMYEASRSRCWLLGLLEVHTFYVELMTYHGATDGETRHEVEEQLMRRGVRLMTEREGWGGCLLEMSVEVRLCWQLIVMELPGELLHKLELSARDPSGEALILDRGAHRYRAPGMSSWVEMGRREVPFRLLCALSDQRAELPGEGMEWSELFERVWPDEPYVTRDSAHNRLYVTVATLRKEGLRDVLVSVAEGYMLAPEVQLLEV